MIGNVCRHDLQGKCRWGAQCRFTHVGQRPPPPISQFKFLALAVSLPTPGGRGLGRCRFDATGKRCPYGTFCLFPHGEVAVPVPTTGLDTHGFGEGLPASWVSLDAIVMDKLLHGWRVFLLTERAALWTVAAVRRQYAVILEWPLFRIVHFHVGDKKVYGPADPVEFRMLPTEEIQARVAALPRQRTLWLLGEPELMWNAVVAYHCLGVQGGRRTCGVAWVDAVLVTPDRTAQMLASIQPDDASVFCSGVVMYR